jgi:chromosome segregation ATPase
MPNDFEVSTINSDTYQYFRTLNKDTANAITEVEEKIKTAETNIARLSKEKQAEETLLENLKKQKATLDTKALDVRAIIADLEKNQASFRQIITK